MIRGATPADSRPAHDIALVDAIHRAQLLHTRLARLQSLQQAILDTFAGLAFPGQPDLIKTVGHAERLMEMACEEADAAAFACEEIEMIETRGAA